MNINHPKEINFDFAPDEGQEAFMAEAHMTKYIDYLRTVADGIGMEVLFSQVLHDEPNLDEQDNKLLDRHLPMYRVQVLDDGDLLSEFVYSYYSGPLYKSFRDWINYDILFYMKSKALYQAYDSKFPERHTIKELAKKV